MAPTFLPVSSSRTSKELDLKSSECLKFKRIHRPRPIRKAGMEPRHRDRNAVRVGKVFDCAPFALDSPNASTTRSIANCASGDSALGFTFPQDKSARLILLTARNAIWHNFWLNDLFQWLR